MPDLIIKISTPADLTGAQATEIAMDAIAKATGTVTTGAQQATQATGRFTDATGRLREADGRFVSLGAAARHAAGDIKEAGGEAESFFEKLKNGIPFGLGVKIGSAIEEGIAELPRKFTEFIDHGIEGLGEFEVRAIGLGVSLRQMEPDKFATFEEARTKGVQVLDLLRERAIATGENFNSLAEVFGVALPTLVESGVTKTSAQIEVLLRLQQMATKAGLSGGQATKDVLDELLGRVERTNFGRELEAQGLTKKAIDEAIASGHLADVLLEKTSAMAEAATAKANTYQGALESVRTELDLLAQEAAKPAFTRISELLGIGKGTLAGSDATSYARGIGNTIGMIMDGATNTVAFFDAHPWLKKLYGLEQTYGAVGIMEGRPLWQPKVDEAFDKASADVVKERAAKANTPSEEDDDGSAARERAAKKDAEAYAKYNARPAGADENDPTAAAATDKREKSINTLAATLEKTWGFTQATAHNIAEETIARAENTKEAEKLNKALDGVVAKQDRLANSADLASKLKDVFGNIRAALPENLDAGLSDNPDEGNLAAVTHAVQAFPVPKDDEAALGTKKSLVELLEKAVALQHDYNAAVSREGQASDRAKSDAKDAAERQQRHDDTIAEYKEETAIMAARAKGEDELADKLERQRDIRREIKALEAAGATSEEATPIAEANVDARNAAQDRKNADRASRRNQGGGYGDFWINGHATDTDVGGGLHTGTTTTGGLGPGGAGATSTVGAAFAAKTPLDALNDPSLRLANPTASGFLDPIAEMNKAVSGTPTATSSFEPAVSPSSTSAGQVSPSGGSDLAAPLNRTATAADGAKGNAAAAAQAAEKVENSMRGVETAVGTLVTKLNDQDARLQSIEAKLNTLGNS